MHKNIVKSADILLKIVEMHVESTAAAFTARRFATLIIHVTLSSCGSCLYICRSLNVFQIIRSVDGFI